MEDLLEDHSWDGKTSSWGTPKCCWS